MQADKEIELLKIHSQIPVDFNMFCLRRYANDEPKICVRLNCASESHMNVWFMSSQVWQGT